MAQFDKKQAPGAKPAAAPKVQVAADKSSAGAAPAPSAAAGYDAQRAELTPGAAGGYDAQRDAVRPGVAAIGGVQLGPAPAGPQPEPRKKRKKRKKRKNTRRTPTPAPVVTPTPAPVVEPTPGPVVEPAPAVEPAPTPAPAPAPEPVKPLDPMRDPNVNPDPTNEYAAEATYAAFSGVIAVQGEGDAHAIDANDVKQGAIGNCYFVAQLAAQAKADPAVIQNLIKDNGDGSYTVSLYLKDKRRPWQRTKTDIVVDARFPTKDGSSAAYAKPGDSGPGGAELWVMLIEKAFAKHCGHYEETRGKKTPDGDVFGMMTGVSSGYRAMSALSSDALLKLCEAAVREGKPVSFGAIDTSAPEELQRSAKEAGVVMNHAYALEGVDAGKRQISLRNPWGSKHLFETDVEIIRKHYSGVRVGA
jgi:hypothetical protein